MDDSQHQITVQSLFGQLQTRLGLNWVAGHAGGDKAICPETSSKNYKLSDSDEPYPGDFNNKGQEQGHHRSLVGYLNLIHPHQIQVLGKTEVDYLNDLRDISRQDAIRQIFNNEPACIIVAEDKEAPMALLNKCNDTNVVLLTTSLSSIKTTESLHYFLTNLFADMLTMHGVFMEVMAIGVLIVGPSGIGKSELAMELITRGHRLVADDAPQFARIAPDIINGTCPEALQDFLEVRGLGIVNVRELFGDSAIKKNKYLKLITRLEPMNNNELLKLDRLEGSYRTRKVLDVDIPEITLPVAPGRNLAVLLECAARNHILRSSGYNAADDFTDRQRNLIDRGKTK